MVDILWLYLDLPWVTRPIFAFKEHYTFYVICTNVLGLENLSQKMFSYT